MLWGSPPSFLLSQLHHNEEPLCDGERVAPMMAIRIIHTVSATYKRARGVVRVAEQLNVEPELSWATDQSRAEAPLDSNRNPFQSGAAGSRLGRPAQTAFGELIRLIALRTPIVVVLGNAGTGKTVLVSIVARACADMGLAVRRIERGDLLAKAAEDRSDVLFVDEADSMSNAVLQCFLSARERQDRTMVFMCLPSCISRFSFSGTEAVVLELSPLSLLDARLYLTERGNSIGRPNLFTLQALDLVIDASRGVPRLLRSIAGLAYFNAATDGASQIAATHAEVAVHMRNEFSPAPSGALNPLPSISEPAQTNNRHEFHAADPDPGLAVVAGVDAAGSVGEKEPQTLSHTQLFGWTEAALDRRWAPTSKSVAALGIVLLIAAAIGFPLISRHNPRNRESQEVSRSLTIALTRPAEATASQPSSERAATTPAAPTQSTLPSFSDTVSAPRPAEPAASQSSSETAPGTLAARPLSTLPSASASTNSVPRAAATKAKTLDVNICASRDPRALPVAGRCPGGQLALPRKAALSSSAPLTRRDDEVDQVAAPKSSDAVAAPRTTPAELVRNTESTPPQALSPSEASAPPSDLPAVAIDKMQTQDPGQVARAAQGDAEQKAAESRHMPVVIFGIRLW